MALSIEKYLQEYHSHLYNTVRRLSQITDKSFSETFDIECGLTKSYKRKLKEKDPALVTNLDLEEIVDNTQGGKKTIKNIAALNGTDEQKADVLRGYLTYKYSQGYIKSVWKAFYRSDIVPGVNAGVVETQKPGNSLGYDNVITPELRNIARLFYHNKSKTNKGNNTLKKLYSEELRRCVIRSINSKNYEDALIEIKRIDRKIRKWIKSL